MKHHTHLFSTLRLVLLAVALSVGLSYAAIWTSPSAGAPGSNIDAPITILSYNQDKPGNLSVNTFAANVLNGNSALKQQAFFRGPVKGIDPGSSAPTLEIGGLASDGTTIKRVVTTANGNINSGMTIGSSELMNNVLNPLCADEVGKVILCEPPAGGPPGGTVVTGTIGTSNGRNVEITLSQATSTTVLFPVSAYFYLNGTTNPSTLYNFMLPVAQSVTGSAAPAGNAPYHCIVPSQVISGQGKYIYDSGSTTYNLTIDQYCN